MSSITPVSTLPPTVRGSQATARRIRALVIGVISFLTLIDLFAAQAILPSLAAAYDATPAEMGVAVNASTFGMAVSGLLVALFSRRINRRKGIWVSLSLLAVPTLLLATMPDLATFTVLRVLQGVFMSASFTLTVAYLAEQCSAEEKAGALAAYVTGNVASNFLGRLMSAAIADHLGLSANFAILAGLNLAGALLVFYSLRGVTPMMADAGPRPPIFAAWAEHLRNPLLRPAFLLGFLILFVFIGAFTYVNFLLVAEPLALDAMQLGFVYFVFLPSIITTPLAGRAVQRFGSRPTFLGALALALFSLPLLLLPSLSAVLLGLVLVAVGTFFAQAAATGYVSSAATGDRGAASGLYLASYYCGGLFGSAVLGQLFSLFGWPATVAGLVVALLLALVCATRLATPRGHR
ncbi:MFS transporter [Limibacillus halophilus]|uniref:Putative MFS family arabinose efflux permease n=1 Tax=Limibacillus halophilus TaxID=1579333 RepID=A0A839SQC2_9PROT|nr:MFS transporter [Limibacillus halophilus]MBB3063950.1 putative MFS family arabinose efflux permease [Limibacillus halophilus]